MTQKKSNGSGSEPPLNDSGLTMQQVMEMGQAASDALKSPIYNASHHLCVQEVIDQWSQTSPKEVNRRESLWYELQAHGKAASRLTEMVARAQELMAKQGAQHEADESDYLDRQGFGFGGDVYQ